MKKIALDFDSVLSDTMHSWTLKHNQLYGTNLSKSDIKTWKFWKDLGIEDKIKDQCFQEAWKDWKNLPPTEQNLDKKVTKLTEYGDVEVLTSVDKNHIGDVKNWLNDKNILNVEVIPTEGKNKIVYDYDLFIDDDPQLATDARSKNKKCFVYHQEWNRSVKESDSIIRIKSLTHAITQISKKGI